MYQEAWQDSDLIGNQAYNQNIFGSVFQRCKEVAHFVGLRIPCNGVRVRANCKKIKTLSRIFRLSMIIYSKRMECIEDKKLTAHLYWFAHLHFCRHNRTCILHFTSKEVIVVILLCHCREFWRDTLL